MAPYPGRKSIGIRDKEEAYNILFSLLRRGEARMGRGREGTKETYFYVYCFIFTKIIGSTYDIILKHVIFTFQVWGGFFFLIFCTFKKI